MRLLRCIKQDALLEYYSIPSEVSFIRRSHISIHMFSCEKCREALQKIESMWSSYFQPEPDVTSSLLKVYSRLQGDETLILKGWKLGDLQRRRSFSSTLFQEGWLFRGAVSMGLAAAVTFVIVSQVKPQQPFAVKNDSRGTIAANKPPVARIRVEDKNTVKVQYLEPELLQTIEFETTRGAR